MTLECRQVSDRISAYVDGVLSAREARAVSAHIASCASCRAELAAEQASVKALESPRMAFEAPDVLAAVKRQVAEPRRRPARLIWRWSLAGVAAACCLTWMAMTLSHMSVRPEPVAPAATAQTPQAPAVAPTPSAEPSVTAATPSESQQVVPTDDRVRVTPRKRVVVRRPNPNRTPEQPPAVPAVEQPASDIDYLVVYNHAGLGDGMRSPEDEAVDESADTTLSSISMIDESTGAVTNVSTFSSSGDETAERATVKFEGKAEPAAPAEGERSSTDEKPLDTIGSADHLDLC